MLQCWRRTGHLPSFFVPTTRDLTVQESPPPEICHPFQKNKCLCPGVSPGGGGLGAAGIDWCINFTRFLHILFMRFKTKGYDVIDLNLFHFKLMRFHFKNSDKSVPPPLLTDFEVANLDWKKYWQIFMHYVHSVNSFVTLITIHLWIENLILIKNPQLYLASIANNYPKIQEPILPGSEMYLLTRRFLLLLLLL